MKYILVLDKADEQRMHSGEMIQIPGQLETFITMEPKRGGRMTAQVDDGEERPRASRAPLAMVKCENCGESFKGAVGVSTHSRHCTGKRRQALPAPSSSPTCKYCRRSFRNVQARSAHQGNCPQKPRKEASVAHA